MAAVDLTDWRQAHLNKTERVRPAESVTETKHVGITHLLFTLTRQTWPFLSISKNQWDLTETKLGLGEEVSASADITGHLLLQVAWESSSEADP